MEKARELIRLAQDCYARARVTVNEVTKRDLVQQGDEYLKQADERPRGHTIVQAAFPKPDLKSPY